MICFFDQGFFDQYLFDDLGCGLDFEYGGEIDEQNLDQEDSGKVVLNIFMCYVSFIFYGGIDSGL